MRSNPVWIFSFSLVTVLLIISIVIYGLDITTPEGTRKAITSQIKNSGKKNYFYKIDDKFAFYAFTDWGNDVGVTTYARNYIPFCFTCGWYTGDPDDDRGLAAPVYKSGDLLYSSRTSDAWAGLPAGVFPTYNMKTHTYGYVKDSLELSGNPFSAAERLTHKLVSESYDEMSYESSDDEDCMISFAAIFLCYIILAIWWLIAFAVKRLRRSRI